MASTLTRSLSLRLIFFFWGGGGYLKDEVYKQRPATTEELKDSIRQNATKIPPEMTVRLLENFRSRLNRLKQQIANRGHRLEDVIFTPNE